MVRDFRQLEARLDSEFLRIQDKYRGVTASVSGGTDSTSLLHVLCEFHKREKIFLSGVIHFNFCLRGQESDDDQMFVENLCKDLQVPVFVIRGQDVSPRKPTSNVQIWARDIRQNYYREMAKKGLIVALGHNLDDQAETLIERMCRGTGLRGMGCMPRFSKGIWRPLLHVSRADIAQYAAQKGWDYRNDSSNISDKYLRNRIRKNVLPQLIEVNSQATKHLAQAADELREFNQWAIQQFSPMILAGRESSGLEVEQFRKLPPGVRRFVIREICRNTLGRGQLKPSSTSLRDLADLILNQLKLVLQSRKEKHNEFVTALDGLNQIAIRDFRLRVEPRPSMTGHPRAIQHRMSIGPREFEALLGAHSEVDCLLPWRVGNMEPYVNASNQSESPVSLVVSLIAPRASIQFADKKKMWTEKLLAGAVQDMHLGKPIFLVRSGPKNLGILVGNEFLVPEDTGEKIPYCGPLRIRIEWKLQQE